MNKTVLLTGATGFLGSQLTKRLLTEGYKVAILKRSFSDTWRIKEWLSELLIYDIDKCNIDHPFKDLGKIDIIIHTATCYGRDNESVSEVFETNTLFPLRLLETATLFGSDTFINTDTYFNTETILYEYLNNYSLSKKHFLELLNISNQKIQGINLKIEHMYGPSDGGKKFVTWLISELLAGKDELKFTKGEQKRDFIYIDDVVSAYLAVLNKSKELDTFAEFDVGTGNQIMIKDFVIKTKEIITKFCGKGNKTELNFGAIPYREKELMEIKEDISPLLALGWTPKILLDEGLEKTVKYEVSKR